MASGKLLLAGVMIPALAASPMALAEARSPERGVHVAQAPAEPGDHGHRRRERKPQGGPQQRQMQPPAAPARPTPPQMAPQMAPRPPQHQPQPAARPAAPMPAPAARPASPPPVSPQPGRPGQIAPARPLPAPQRPAPVPLQPRPVPNQPPAAARPLPGPGQLQPPPQPARPAAPTLTAPARPAAPAQIVPPGPAPAGPQPLRPAPPPAGQGAGAPPARPQGPPGAPTPGLRPPPQAAPAPLPAQPNPPRSGMSGAGAAAVGAAAGVAAGVLAVEGARRLDDLRQRRQESRDGDRTIVREPGRTFVREGGRIVIHRDETERVRELGADMRTQRSRDGYVSSFDRPNGERIITYLDEDGRLLRRVRRTPDGRETIIIDNRFGGRRRPGFADYVVILPPPPLRIPPDVYIVDAGRVDERDIYETLIAPPVAPIPQRYTLDQVRYSVDLRARMRSVDLDTINFDSGSWTVTPDQARLLGVIAQALRQALQRNPDEVFLIEGYTDAVGGEIDNLSLSDRRAQSVAEILTRDFGVPPENLTTQGYGEEYLRVNTQGASRANRRVTVRRITPLLTGEKAPR